MKDILSILIVVLLGLVPTFIKMVKGEDPQKRGKVQTRKRTEPYYAPSMEERDEEMQNLETNLRNEPEYFTYERIGDDFEQPEKQVQNRKEDVIQQTDIQEDKIDLSFESEEIRKGIIYSEILKRKY